jgi:hypothetical protein
LLGKFVGRLQAVADQGVELGILLNALLGFDFFKPEAKDFHSCHGQSTKVVAISVNRRDIRFALYPHTKDAVFTAKKGA